MGKQKGFLRKLSVERRPYWLLMKDTMLIYNTCIDQEDDGRDLMWKPDSTLPRKK
jgi:hypothetical protein